VVDDHTFHPVLAGDCVLFASSADDSVYCLDATAGTVRWRQTTDGPVRYAPSVVAERVYAGSDDGSVYCFDLADGRLHWRRRLAPTDRMVPGNGRLISAWPIRTGVAVADGVAYAAAGLYPSQGVSVWALAADTGEPIWKQPIDYSAHGYLLMTADRLIVPTGRSTPVVLNRSDGRVQGQVKGSPGSYAVLAGEEVFSGRGNSGTLEAADLASRNSLVTVPAQHVCVTPSRSYLLGRGHLQAIDLTRFMQLSRQLSVATAERERAQEHFQQLSARGTQNGDQRQQMQELISQSTDRINTLSSQREATILWNLPTRRHGCLAAGENFVLVGGNGATELRDPTDGRLLQELAVDGTVLGVALADERIYVSTTRGEIYCFGSPHSAPPLPSASQSASASQSTAVPDSAPASHTAPHTKWRPLVAAIVKDQLRPAFGSTRGYALVAGADDYDLLGALYDETDLTILAVDTDRQTVAETRRRLQRDQRYPARVAVLQVEPGRLPVADYVANLVVSARGLAGETVDRWDREELMRVVRPAGGLAWLKPHQPPVERGPLPGAGRWVHQYGNPGNTADSGDHQVSWDLRLQWFGGPGPAQMVDRHLRAPAPLAADGRMYIGGENLLVGVDSYHGTQYWQKELPGAQRYSMPYDCGYTSIDGDRVATAVRDAVWVLDARTGETLQTLRVPASDGDSPESHWGYVVLRGDQILGSIQKATASRTVPTRELIDQDYGNARPLVTGTGLFLMECSTGQVRWQQEAIVLNPTLAATAQRVFFVAATADGLRSHPTGQILLERLLESGAEVRALDAETGHTIWSQPVDPYLAVCRNILYLQAAGDRLVLSGSYPRDNDSFYRVAVLDAVTGATLWKAEHAKGKAGEFTHGEQVHHPVILGDRLVCEPAIYEFATGRRIAPDGTPDDWVLKRPAHSCGTMSGAGDCLFFRSGNPTVMSLGPNLESRDRFRSISPSRPGCWINIIPADGLVLIPEASASCVCHYSLQTSMAFQAVPRREVDTAGQVETSAARHR
jgi:outer membrane protein assembly factor BamB